MAQNQCGKCGEMVDTAKAFCPGCGNPFVEEEAREVSGFEKMDNTVQLGQTMYNQMLSDMGLSVERESPYAKRIETVEPATAVATPVKKTADPQPGSGKSNRTKWIILAAVIVAVMIFLGLLAAAAILYYFWPRIS